MCSSEEVFALLGGLTCEECSASSLQVVVLSLAFPHRNALITAQLKIWGNPVKFSKGLFQRVLCSLVLCPANYNHFHLNSVIFMFLQLKDSLGHHLSFSFLKPEKTLESPLNSKEIQPVHPKGNQSWIFIGRTEAEAEAPILWPPDAKSQLTGKDPDVRKDWGREEKGVTEDEMVGWHHRLSGHEFEQTLGDSEGQGSLVCCSPWGHK